MNFPAFSLSSQNEPLYQQIYTFLRQQIIDGTLPKGYALPSRRKLAFELHVSVNTVSTAYDMLCAEGYIESKPRSGFFVCAICTQFPSKASMPVSVANPKPLYQHSFSTSYIDTNLFPFKTWRRIQQTVVSQNPSLLNHGESNGDFTLRQAISLHLQENRGVICGAHQIIIGAGMEYLLSMLAQFFSNEIFAIENPGYPRTSHILKNHHIPMRFIPVDEHGMQPSALTDCDATIAYLTPSHQFPTGVTMPITRRSALLTWAASQKNRYLIEDDYDSEFRFDTRPLPSLQGMDTMQHVIYAGTFSKSLAPAFRIAYLVLPEHLLTQWNHHFSSYACTVNRFEQHTLANFMNSGSFSRHLRRLRIVYRKRRDLLVECLREAFPHYSLQSVHTGVYLLLCLPEHIQANQAVLLAQKAGIDCTSLSSYTKENLILNQQAVVLGYGGLAESEIPLAVSALSQAWKNLS